VARPLPGGAKRYQQFQRHGGAGKGLPALARGQRRDGSPAWGPRPGMVERHGAAVPSPSLHDALRVAWRGGAASRRAMYRGWPARPAGTPRPGLLFRAAEAHLALGPPLRLGARALAMQKHLHCLGDSRTIGETTSVTRARAPPVRTTAARGRRLVGTR
jgi:hypothetical protein